MTQGDLGVVASPQWMGSLSCWWVSTQHLPKPGRALQNGAAGASVFAVGQTHSNGCCHHLHLKGKSKWLPASLGGSLSSASMSAPGSFQITASVQFSSVQSLGRVRLFAIPLPLCQDSNHIRFCVHLLRVESFFYSLLALP